MSADHGWLKGYAVPSETTITTTFPTTGAEAPADYRAYARRRHFLYQDGVVISSVIRALASLDLLEAGPGKDCGLPETGYLGVVRRSLASVGWFDGDAEPAGWTPSGRAALRHRDDLVQAGRLLARFAGSTPDAWQTPWDAETSDAFSAAVRRLEERQAGNEQDELAGAFLEGALAVPAMLLFRAREGSDGIPQDVKRLLSLLGWVDAECHWTPKGRAFRDFSDHFALAGSCLPLLARLEELLRGELVVSPGGDQWHGERTLMARAGSAAHRRYFADADPVFQEMFAYGRPPAFIADMGCGDGSWLVHLHSLFGDSVRYIGIDASPVALDDARQKLQAAGVPDPLLLLGDVASPLELRAQLAEHGLSMEDGLHIRAFTDHERTYHGGSPSDAPGSASGAYVAPDGTPLSAAAVEADLVAHLERWKPHIGKHGMVLLEAHCVPPHVASRHLGTLHSVAFDAYRGLSHRYPVEYSTFMDCCRRAGLSAVSHLERRHPATRPFVAVSVNHLVCAQPNPLEVIQPAGRNGQLRATAVTGPDPATTVRAGDWRPEPGSDLDDGRGLHELLYWDGDLSQPRRWSSGATGVVVRDVMTAINARAEQAGRGDVIRVLDYGAGTGLASIELSKICIAQDLPERLAGRGIGFELHLVDLPTGWFAQGHELLKDVPWARFHSLRGDDGGFRGLLDVMNGDHVDVVMANMVFHLLRQGPMRHAAASIADVLAPGGKLVFNAPDLAPATRNSVLFHDPNRLLRQHWLNALDAADPSALPTPLREAVVRARAAGNPNAQERADRRILPTPQSIEGVVAALEQFMTGITTSQTFELLAEENLATALVPSNQAEYLAEITDRATREAVIRHIVREHVFPEISAGPAATGRGYNIEWKFGVFERRQGIS
ncbi:methyltransferase domain-containing protein [Streptomyces sp. NPDC001262]|uniref:AprA-related methyltransferase n=1 Tax=Streptomyces sp. NPDC001262 TaxID=3364552 RepID=UPI00367A11AC